MSLFRSTLTWGGFLLELLLVGLEDREALLVLRRIFDVDPGLGDSTDRLVRAIYQHWFVHDPSARELFPPELVRQRAVFAEALRWVYGELADQRAENLVKFLAQLGRDHRKYGVRGQHYASLQAAMYSAMRSHLRDLGAWTESVDAAAEQSLNLIAGVMRGAADAETDPPWWEATIVEHLRVSRDLAVVRLVLDQPLPYHPGQYVDVEIPQRPHRWRCLSPAIPTDPEGRIEFHVRVVPGGLVSTAIVREAQVGDRWRLGSPRGGLTIDRNDGDVLMVAGSTGLAPLRALILDLTRFADNPRVHLFYAGRYRCELYDLPTLWEVAQQNPWLSVTPISEFTHDPSWAADYPDVSVPRGLHVLQTGRAAEVVAAHGGWGDRQILISGNPDMVQTTKAALIAKGTPAQRIQHDPPTR